MRSVIAALPLLALAACGGASGPQAVGSVAPPTGGTGGTGSGVVTGPGTPATTTDHFLAVAAEKTFDAIGSMHSIDADATGTLYRGNASTVRTPSGRITYNPRDGVFSVNFVDANAGISRNVRFQDPAHRTNFPGARSPEAEVPEYQGFNYLSALDGTTPATFFYQRPGASTHYVSLAGFVRTEITATRGFKSEHGVFVFGDQTLRSQIPISGSGSYTGGFLATMIVNPTLDSTSRGADFLQWMNGTSRIDINFATGAVGLQINGLLSGAYVQDQRVDNLALSVPAGAAFSATGNGVLNLISTGGFTGKFTSANFSWNNGNVPVQFQSVNPINDTAGATSFDGTFFGPNAVNVGGNFRIVGGVPDQRVDILGAFTGAKQP